MTRRPINLAHEACKQMRCPLPLAYLVVPTRLDKKYRRYRALAEESLDNPDHAHRVAVLCLFEDMNTRITLLEWTIGLGVAANIVVALF